MSTLKSSAEDLTLNADGSGNDVIIQSDGSTKAIVTAEGNVGIGVTPESGWHSSLSTLQFGGLGSLHAPSSTGAGNDINLVQNGYTDGSWKHQINDESSLYRQANGTHEFKVAASGAADAAITFTTPLSIANGGDVTVGTGNLVIGTAGKGIDFSAQTATTAGTTTSEVLDHYEEGTWTPILSDGTNDAVSYTDNVGRYVKIGSMVTIYFAVQASNMGSISGTTYIMDLPFTVTQCSNPYPQGVLDVYATASNLTGYQCLQISGAGDRLTMIYNAGLTSGHIAITDAYLDTGTTMRGQIQYFTH